MQYELYLDVLLLTDFIMNLMILCLAGKFLRMPLHMVRLILSALTGGILHITVLIVMLKTGYGILGILSPAIAAVMVRMAFYVQGIQVFFRLYAALAGTSTMLSGLMQAANPLQRKTAMIFVLTAAGAYAFLMILCRIFQNIRRERSHLYPVKLFIEEKEICATGLLDTGNRLLDPFYHKPVQILDHRVFLEMFPNIKDVTDPSVFSERMKFHLIPYHSIGKNQGLLPAVIFSRMLVITDAGEREIKDAVIAFTKDPVSADGRYQMILHEECIG